MTKLRISFSLLFLWLTITGCESSFDTEVCTEENTFSIDLKFVEGLSSKECVLLDAPRGQNYLVIIKSRSELEKNLRCFSEFQGVDFNNYFNWLSATLPVSRRGKNIIGVQLIIGRFGLPCLTAGGRLPCLPAGRHFWSQKVKKIRLLVWLQIYVLKNQFFPASEKRFDCRKSEMVEQLRRSDLMTHNIFNFDVTPLRIKSHRWCYGRFYNVCYNQNAPRTLTWTDRKSGTQINWSVNLMNLRIYILKNLIIRYFASHRRGKNIIGAQLIIGRFGLPCLPAGRRLRSSVPISKENKATGVIADIHIILLLQANMHIRVAYYLIPN